MSRKPTPEGKVTVYRILHKAGRPLTLDEIAVQVNSDTHVRMWWEGKIKASINWNDEALHEAKRQWCLELLDERAVAQVSLKHFKVTRADDRAINMHTTPDQKVWSAGRPPKVMAKRWVLTEQYTDWSPEVDHADAQLNGARRFLRAVDGADHMTKAELLELIEHAKQALADYPDEQP